MREHGTQAFEACVEQAVPLSRQLIEAAREGTDITTAEGRARLLATAKPLWQALPDGALKRSLLGELTALGQLPLADLADLWGVRAARPVPAPGVPRPPPRRPARTVMRRPEDNAARLLLLHCQWWGELGTAEHELLCERPDWHGELFRWLDRRLHDQGPQPWSVLREPLLAEPWGAQAAALIETLDVEVEPLLDDLRATMTQLASADLTAAAYRALGRV